MRRLSRSVSRLYDQHLQEAGLKTTQFSVLNMLSESPASISHLADRLGLERTSLSRNLKPLFARGLLDTLPDPDSRQKVLCLSDAGRTTLRAGRRAWQKAQRAFEAILEPGVASALNDTVARIQSRLDREPDPVGQRLESA